MALTPEKHELKGTGTGTRFVIGGQVVLAALLALAAVVLVTWLSERRGLRWRTDLTASGENTLDPVSIAVIAKLPSDVDVDVFFTAPEEPFQQVGPVAQDRMQKLLRRAIDESAGRIHVTQHDLSDRANLPAASKARMVELNLAGIEPGGLFVVSMGKRREIVRLRPDIADIDPGQPDRRMGPYVPARLVNFRGEEALVSALLKVSQGDAPKVLFTSGHGSATRSPSIKSASRCSRATSKATASRSGYGTRRSRTRSPTTSASSPSSVPNSFSPRPRQPRFAGSSRAAVA